MPENNKLQVEIRRMIPEDIQEVAALEVACFSEPWRTGFF